MTTFLLRPDVVFDNIEVLATHISHENALSSAHEAEEWVEQLNLLLDSDVDTTRWAAVALIGVLLRNSPHNIILLHSQSWALRFIEFIKDPLSPALLCQACARALVACFGRLATPPLLSHLSGASAFEDVPARLQASPLMSVSAFTQRAVAALVAALNTHTSAAITPMAALLRRFGHYVPSADLAAYAGAIAARLMRGGGGFDPAGDAAVGTALAGALALPCFARHHAALLRTLLADCEARAGALLVTGSPLESPPPLAPLFTAAGLPAPPPPPTASPLAAQLSAAVWISPAVEGASLQPAPIVPKNSTAAVAATAAAAVAKSPGPETNRAAGERIVHEATHLATLLRSLGILLTRGTPAVAPLPSVPTAPVPAAPGIPPAESAGLAAGGLAPAGRGGAVAGGRVACGMRTAVLAERSLMGAVATLARRILEADFARLGGIQLVFESDRAALLLALPALMVGALDLARALAGALGGALFLCPGAQALARGAALHATLGHCVVRRGASLVLTHDSVRRAAYRCVAACCSAFGGHSTSIATRVLPFLLEELKPRAFVFADVVQPSGPLAALFGAPSCRGPAGNLAVSAGLAAGKLARKRRRRQADQQRRQQARALEEHAERAATLAGDESSDKSTEDDVPGDGVGSATRKVSSLPTYAEEKVKEALEHAAAVRQMAIDCALERNAKERDAAARRARFAESRAVTGATRNARTGRIEWRWDASRAPVQREAARALRILLLSCGALLARQTRFEIEEHLLEERETVDLECDVLVAAFVGPPHSAPLPASSLEPGSGGTLALTALHGRLAALAMPLVAYEGSLYRPGTTLAPPSALAVDMIGCLRAVLEIPMLGEGSCWTRALEIFKAGAVAVGDPELSSACHDGLATLHGLTHPRGLPVFVSPPPTPMPLRATSFATAASLCFLPADAASTEGENNGECATAKSSVSALISPSLERQPLESQLGPPPVPLPLPPSPRPQPHLQLQLQQENARAAGTVVQTPGPTMEDDGMVAITYEDPAEAPTSPTAPIEAAGPPVQPPTGSSVPLLPEQPADVPPVLEGTEDLRPVDINAKEVGGDDVVDEDEASVGLVDAPPDLQ